MQVTALARSPEKLNELVKTYPDKLKVIQGSIEDAEKVKSVVQLQDWVVNSLGGGLEVNTVCSAGSALIIDAMKQFGVKKTLVVTSFGCNDSWNDTALFLRPIFYLMLRHALRDKNIQEDHYANSDLEYTIVRPGGLRDTPATGKYRVGEHISSRMVSREDVADFLIKQLEKQEYLRKAVTISD